MESQSSDTPDSSELIRDSAFSSIVSQARGFTLNELLPAPRKDITNEFFTAAAALPQGQLAKSPQFDLRSGTHALEALNPTMDTGLIQLSLEERCFDCQSARSLADVTYVATRLLTGFTSWLSGASLPQTVLSCRYVEVLLDSYSKMRSVEGCTFVLGKVHEEVLHSAANSTEFLLVHRVLRAVVVASVFLCQVVLSYAQAGVVYEEEDISACFLDLDLLLNVSQQEVCAVCEDALKWLAQAEDEILKSAQSSETSHTSESSEIPSSVPASKHLSSLSHILLILLRLVQALPAAGTLTETTELGDAAAAVAALQSSETELESLPQIPGCFSMGIQKRAPNKVPPRSLDTASVSSACDLLNRTFRDLTAIRAVGRNYSHSLSIWQFCSFFAAAQPTPSLLSRAYLQFFLVRDDRKFLGRYEFSKFADDSASQFAGGPTLSSLGQDVREPLAAQAASFAEQAVSVLFGELSLASHNPCRQREDISRQIVQWDSLQVASEDLELQLQASGQYRERVVLPEGEQDALPVSSWVFSRKLESMAKYLLMGVQLEVYQLWELSVVYWYVEYLQSVHVAHGARCVAYAEQKLDVWRRRKKNRSKGNNRKPGRRITAQEYDEKISELELSKRWLVMSMSVLTARGLLAKALFILLTVLGDLKLLAAPKPEFTSLRLLYGVRFKSFSSVGVPEFLRYEDWQRQVKVLAPPVDQRVAEKVAHYQTALGQAANYARLGKQKVEAFVELAKVEGPDQLCLGNYWEAFNAEAKLLLRSSVAVSLSVAKVAKCVPRLIESENPAKAVTVSLDREGFHRHFPSVKIVETAQAD